MTTSNRTALSYCLARCGRVKGRNHYLCSFCWPQLPDRTQRALYRRDGRATLRLLELQRAIRRDIPLTQIEVTP